MPNNKTLVTGAFSKWSDQDSVIPGLRFSRLSPTEGASAMRNRASGMTKEREMTT
jgi:hypothetical protein